MWKASKISISTKIRLFNSNVKSALLYGCETWKTTQGVINKLQVFVIRWLRKFWKLKWTDKIRNEQPWERTGQVRIQNEIGRRRWKWVGHTLRKGKNSITRQALQWNPQGSRGRGRPRETWRRCLEIEMKDVGITWVNLSKKAQDRDVWRMFVCGLMMMMNRDWYLHVKSSTKHRYVRYKISDLSVHYSMFRHIHRIAHLSDVIRAIPGCTHLSTGKKLMTADEARRLKRRLSRLNQYTMVSSSWSYRFPYDVVNTDHHQVADVCRCALGFGNGSQHIVGLNFDPLGHDVAPHP